MKNWVLYLSMAALLVALCALLGAIFSRILGIDALRDTPGKCKKGAAGMVALGRTMSFTAILPMALWMGATMVQVMGPQLGAMACMGYALACAMLSFCAMFASVRHNAEGMSCVCEEELFTHAGKVRLSLGLTAMLLGASALLMSLMRDGQVDMSNGLLFVFSCMLWPVIGLQMTANCLACMIQSERQILLCATVGPVGAALVAAFALMPGAEMSMNASMEQVVSVAVTVIWVLAWMMLCRAGGVALQGLLEDPVSRRRPSLLLTAPLCALVSVPFALLADQWLFMLVPVVCVAIVLMDISACGVWFAREGLGMFPASKKN